MKILNKNKVFLIVFFTLILITIPISKRVFHTHDELKYVVICENILKYKNPFVFFVDNSIYTDKPPLFFWIILLTKFILGNYYTYGIVIFNIIIESIFITKIYNFLKNKVENSVRIFSIFMIITSVLQYLALVKIRMDIFMEGFIILALLSFYECFEKKDFSKIYKFYIYAGLAFLFKGLVGLLTPFAVILLFRLFIKEKYTLKDLKLGYGIFIIFLFVLSWLLPAYLTFGNYFIYDLFHKQVVSRTMGDIHKAPFYYYLYSFPVVLFPWTVAVIYSIYKYVKDFIQKNYISTHEKFLLLWVVITVIYLSFASGKLQMYLLPVVPPALILCAIKLKEASNIVKFRITFITFIIFLLAFISFFFIKSKNFIPIKFIAISCVFIILLLFGISLALKKKELAYFVFGLFLPVLTFIFGFNINVLNRELSRRALNGTASYEVPSYILKKVYKDFK